MICQTPFMIPSISVNIPSRNAKRTHQEYQKSLDFRPLPSRGNSGLGRKGGWTLEFPL